MRSSSLMGRTARDVYGTRPSFSQAPTIAFLLTFHSRSVPSAPEAHISHRALSSSAASAKTADVLDEWDSVRTTRPCRGEKQSITPSDKPTTTTSVALFLISFSDSPVLFVFFLLFLLGSNSSVLSVSPGYKVLHINDETRPVSTR